MIDLDNIKFAKVLEDRMNIIEGSYGNSFLEIPISQLQARTISNVDDLGLNYLLNYQTIRYGTAINLGIYASEFYKYINYSEQYKEDLKNAIMLEVNNDLSNFEKLLYRRRSVRKYKKEQMSFKDFSNIFVHAQDMRNINGLFLKNTPSGGGLYPIDMYIYANRVDALQQGVYRLQPLSNTLSTIKVNCKKDILKIFSNQLVLDLENCSVIVLFSFDYAKMYQKYSELTLALGMIEIGTMAQTIHLLSKDHGYGSCDIGGFDKPKAEALLNLDGIDRHVVYGLIIGREDNDKDL